MEYVRVVTKENKLLETKRFKNRSSLDDYVYSLENFYDMVKERELYTNKYGNLGIKKVWTIVVNE